MSWPESPHFPPPPFHLFGRYDHPIYMIFGIFVSFVLPTEFNMVVVEEDFAGLSISIRSLFFLAKGATEGRPYTLGRPPISGSNLVQRDCLARWDTELDWDPCCPRKSRSFPVNTSEAGLDNWNFSKFFLKGYTNEGKGYWTVNYPGTLSFINTLGIVLINFY